MQQFEIDTLRALSLIFTPSNFDRVVRENDAAYTTRNMKRNFQGSSAFTYGKALSSIYKELGRCYKNEYFFKNTLLNDVLTKEDLSATTILNEFQIGKSIADVVVLNGHARVYEIKTDLDDLTKLEKQLIDYCQFANEVYVVASSKFAERLCEKYADTSIGVLELNENDEVKTLKKAKNNDLGFTHTTLFKTLRQNEYKAIVKNNFGSVPDVPNTLLFKSCLNLCREIEIKQFQKIVFNKLKDRKLQCPDLLTSIKTPIELKYICHALDLTASDYADLYSFLNKPLHPNVLPIPKRKAV
jgi:hypothetical protein